MADKAEPAASIWGSPTFQTRSQSKAESSTAEAASTYETMHSNIETGVVTFEEGSVSGARLAASKPAPFPSTAAYSASEAVYHDEGVLVRKVQKPRIAEFFSSQQDPACSASTDGSQANNNARNRQISEVETESLDVLAGSPCPSNTGLLEHFHAAPRASTTSRTTRRKPNGSMYHTLRDLPLHAQELILLYAEMPPYNYEVDPAENFLIALGAELGFD